jgi:hypothetical protein
MFRPVRSPFFIYHPHPFVPFFWGPTWRPIGYVTPRLAPTAIVINVNHRPYHFNDGVFFSHNDRGYEVVAAPMGAVVRSLPAGNSRIMVGDNTFYYFGGVFYEMANNNQFRVVPPPPGAIVTQLPEGATEMMFDGMTFLEFQGTFYQPIIHNGQNAFVVVESE